MQICQRSMVRPTVLGARIFCVLTIFLALGITESFADTVTFYSTSTADSSHWQVATNVGGTDGSFSSFPTAGFVTATALSGSRTNWIANNSTGSNGSIGTWTFFVFRQTFTLAGYNPTTADLQFQWAADDSGQGFSARGTWTPKYVLNPTIPIALSSLTAGIWPSGLTYNLSPVADISSGFVSGLNTIYFFVEGNGQTDGFSLMNASLTADPANPGTSVPEPSTMLLLGSGLVGLAGCGRRRLKK